MNQNIDLVITEIPVTKINIVKSKRGRMAIPASSEPREIFRFGRKKIYETDEGKRNASCIYSKKYYLNNKSKVAVSSFLKKHNELTSNNEFMNKLKLLDYDKQYELLISNKKASLIQTIQDTILFLNSEEFNDITKE